MMVTEGDILWQASDDRLSKAVVTDFLAFLAERGHVFDDYAALHHWSVTDLDGFWLAVRDFFGIEMDGDLQEVVTSDPMPRTRWFTGTRMNFAEQVLRHEATGDPSRVMLHHCSETRPLAAMSWAEVGGQVRKLATRLRQMGVTKGDRVVAYMPNIPETVIAMLAATSLGATWATAAPEFGPPTVIDRFSPIEPKLVFAVNGYRYGGKDVDRTGDLSRILSHLPSATTLVMLDYLPGAAKAPEFHGEVIDWDAMLGGPEIAREDFTFERVASDHPLWTLFSSGTTGLPKPIVHSHHGIVLEHLKNAAFGLDLGAGDTYFCYSTTGWMVWNTLMHGPLLNGQATLYDGHPTYPDAGALWRIIEATRVSHFGVSPTFMTMVRQQGIVPGRDYDLSALKSMFLTGSPATPEILAWIHEGVKKDLFATTQSGGTEVCGGILAGTILLPVRAGEIQAPALGCDACAFDEDGKVVIDEVGELVIRKPMPSMPLFLWGDEDFARYEDSYFDTYPGIWRHGDRVRFNARGGSYVLGRSDATLNRFGVRIGSAEIYRTMEGIEGVADSLIICIEDGQGGYYMPLFVQMHPGAALDDAKRAEIVKRLRSERSPRHVPDEIVEAPEIPTTLTGKKMEVPVRKLLLGQPVDKVASRDATKNPAALDWFADFAAARVSA